MARKYHLEGLLSHLLEIYIKPLDKMIERRAKYYLHLSEKDLFGMTDLEAKKHNDKIQEVGTEVENLAKVKSAVSDLYLVFAEAFEEVENNLKRTQDIAYQLSLDLITIRQTLQTSSDWEAFLLEKVISLDPLLYCKIPSSLTRQHA